MPTTCWNCGYDLAGLSRDVPCPECGITKPWLEEAEPKNSLAVPGLVLGIVSLVLVACTGPFALLVAAPTLVLCWRGFMDAEPDRHGAEDVMLAIIGASFAALAALISIALMYLLLRQ